MQFKAVVLEVKCVFMLQMKMNDALMRKLLFKEQVDFFPEFLEVIYIS